MSFTGHEGAEQGKLRETKRWLMQAPLLPNELPRTCLIPELAARGLRSSHLHKGGSSETLHVDSYRCSHKHLRHFAILLSLCDKPGHCEALSAMCPGLRACQMSKQRQTFPRRNLVPCLDGGGVGKYCERWDKDFSCLYIPYTMSQGKRWS